MTDTAHLHPPDSHNALSSADGLTSTSSSRGSLRSSGLGNTDPSLVFSPQHGGSRGDGAPPRRTKSIASARYWDDLLGLAFGLGVNQAPHPPPSRASSVTSSNAHLIRSPSNFSAVSRASSRTSLASPVSPPKKRLSFVRRRSSVDRRTTSAVTDTETTPAEGVVDEMRFFNRVKTNDSTVLRAVPETDAAPQDYFAGMTPMDHANQEIMDAISPSLTYQSKSPVTSYVSPLTLNDSTQSIKSGIKSPKSPRSRRRHHTQFKDAELVGYWKDGKVHWVAQESGSSSSSGSSDESPPTPPMLPKENSLPFKPGQGLAASRQAKRPGIKLQIPSGIYTTPIPQPVPFVPQASGQAKSPPLPSPGNSLSPKQRGQVRKMVRQMSADRPRHPLEAIHDPQPAETDAASIYSSRTHITAMQQRPRTTLQSRHLHRPSVFSVQDPVAAGVFDDSQSIMQPENGKFDNSDRFSISGYSVQDPVAHGVFDDSRSVFSMVSHSSTVRSAVRKASSTTPDNKRLRRHMMAARKVFDQLPPVPDLPGSPPQTPPAIPARSRKRDLKLTLASVTSVDATAVPPTDACTAAPELDASHDFVPSSAVPIPRQPKNDLDALLGIQPRPLSLPVNKSMAQTITPSAAQAVMLAILENIDSFKDLASASRVNGGFYSVFRRFELRLVKRVLWNRSPAAWELRESSPKEIITSLISNPALDYSPTRYMQFHTRDSYIISALKSLILVRCQSYLRSETIMALRIADTPRGQQVDDALWRIWTFCMVFGCGKAREDDIQGQIDWIRGGVAARASQTVASEAIDSNSILVNAPKHFARGNPDGLTADQIYDMTEMWNCITALLSGIQGRGRAKQARKRGIFNGQRLETGDLEEEERVLQEWAYYVATLGLSAVCDLAIPATVRGGTVFDVAEDMGWTQWHRPLHGGSRGNFLREALSTVYAELVSPAPLPSDMADQRKERGLQLALELRQKKSSPTYAELPLSEDRPMSIMSNWMLWERQTAKYASPEDAAPPPPPPKDAPEASAKSTPPSRQPSHANLSLIPIQYKAPSPSLLSPRQPQSMPDLVPHLSNSSTDSSRAPSPLHSRSSTRSGKSASTAPSSVHHDSPDGKAGAEMGEIPIALPSYATLQSTAIPSSSIDRKLFRLVEMGFGVEDARRAMALADDGGEVREDIALERLLRGRI